MTTLETITGLVIEQEQLKNKGLSIKKRIDELLKEGKHKTIEIVYIPMLEQISEDINRIARLLCYHKEILNARNYFCDGVVVAVKQNNWKKDF